MFDTFDILVPKVLASPPLEVRRDETLDGPDDQRFLYVGTVKMARVLPAHVAFSNVVGWTGSPLRAKWTTLLVRDQANVAVRDDGDWLAFLDALRTVLMAHPEWRVTCESDCEQYPLETLDLTPDEMVAQLASYRRTHHFPIAFCSGPRTPAPNS